MKLNILLLLLIFCSCSLMGQLVQPQSVITKYENGKLKVRWEPQSIDEWNQSLKSGYMVELYESGANTPISNRMVHRLKYDDFQNEIGKVTAFKQPFFEGSMKLMYPERSSEPSDNLRSYFGDESKSGLDSLRLGFLIYSSIYDFKLTEFIGLGTSFSVSQGKKYRVKIYTPGFPAMEHTFMTILENKEVPKLIGEWDDKLVNLEWNTSDYKKDYYGYYVAISEDGIKYELLDSIPWVNTNDRHELDSKSVLSSLRREFKLEQNEKTYYLRLRGLDYFGEMSSKNSMIVGQGFSKLTLSPFIIFADQTEQNEAHLKWDVPDQEQNLVTRFSVLRADSINGAYSMVVDDIPPRDREIKIPMDNTRNFFRINAYAKGKDGLSSNAVFVMGMDTIPPATPEIIGAYLDTIDRAVVEWHANTESDLWGYRVFKGNFSNDEFTLLNAYPTLDTVFVDTLDLDLGNKNVYYFVEAADKRNNRSPLSDTINITLPDVVPPLPPMVSTTTQIDTFVRVFYAKSGSEDAVAHSIYRRDVKVEDGWQRLRILSLEELSEFYDDTDIEYGHHYAYTITATDAAGNESIPEYYQEIMPIIPVKDFEPFVSIKQELDKKEKLVTISWECDKQIKLKSILVYRGQDLNRMSKYKYVELEDNSFKDDCTKYEGQKVYYKLKPVYEGQKLPWISEPITVDCSFENVGKGE